ncbi:hypothetical protein ASG52_03530 [Methylobacterium sp. Leaf456]|uniref:hypothetical protein n=1 Tax=Methylobacterium sp. Leaf456 TaxID=1736382 RepID=UPI0006F68EBB|nr:hypothetical protein [Methylobacterium sp. Leaf456]KQT57149.1 hypothetical protein ASG52_03530 [Methylobacterium sp. Leaf456]
MALDVDGYAVLQAMAAAPEAFPDIRAEIPKAARALVVRQLKARGLKAHALRNIRDVIGTEAFALIADGMTDAEVKAVVARLDPHHPTLKQATPGWLRRRLAALAAGEAPLRRGESVPPEPAAPVPPRAFGSRPFAAVWDGVDHDAPAASKADRKEAKAAAKKERKEPEKKKGKKKD